MPEGGIIHAERVTLLDLLDRLVDKGVVVHGDILLSLAGVDLIYVGLRLLVCAADRLPAFNDAGRKGE